MSYSVTDKINMLLQRNDPVTRANSDKFACENLNVNVVCVQWVFRFNIIYIYSFVFVFNYFVYSSLM